MKRTIKYFAVLILCISFMANSIPVHAAGASVNACSQHDSGILYRREVIADVLVRTHEVLLNGVHDTCYVHHQVIREIYICYNCKDYIILEYAESDQHTICDSQ